jgi:hypothetical protein
MRGAATVYLARGLVAEHGEATGRLWLMGKTRRFADSCWLDGGTPPNRPLPRQALHLWPSSRLGGGLLLH